MAELISNINVTTDVINADVLNNVGPQYSNNVITFNFSFDATWSNYNKIFYIASLDGYVKYTDLLTVVTSTTTPVTITSTLLLPSTLTSSSRMVLNLYGENTTNGDILTTNQLSFSYIKSQNLLDASTVFPSSWSPITITSGNFTAVQPAQIKNINNTICSLTGIATVLTNLTAGTTLTTIPLSMLPKMDILKQLVTSTGGTLTFKLNATDGTITYISSSLTTTLNATLYLYMDWVV